MLYILPFIEKKLFSFIFRNKSNIPLEIEGNITLNTLKQDLIFILSYLRDELEML